MTCIWVRFYCQGPNLQLPPSCPHCDTSLFCTLKAAEESDRKKFSFCCHWDWNSHTGDQNPPVLTSSAKREFPDDLAKMGSLYALSNHHTISSLCYSYIKADVNCSALHITRGQLHYAVAWDPGPRTGMLKWQGITPISLPMPRPQVPQSNLDATPGSGTLPSLPQCLKKSLCFIKSFTTLSWPVYDQVSLCHLRQATKSQCNSPMTVLLRHSSLCTNPTSEHVNTSAHSSLMGSIYPQNGK